MELFFALNFLYVTIPLSTTGEGVKYGGYSLILFAKYLVVYWAAAHVPIDLKRMQVLHVAALMALLWVTVTMWADRFYLIEIDDLTNHLPRIDAGRWSVIGLDSTVSANAGGTTAVILILGALAVATARHRFAWLVEGGFFVLGMASSFISGSRQGLVRMAAFVATYSVVKAVKYFVLVLAFLVVAVILYFQNEPPQIEVSPYFLQALDRQEVLLTDPFSNEGLSGRPEIWQSVLDTLNAEPIRWVVGYGMGNYVEYQNAAHNMVLQFLQDGGTIELVLVGTLWIRIFRRIWMVRREAWAMVALTAGMFTSFFTSTIFYPNLASGWYLGLYFVTMHIMLGDRQCQ
jgi:O-antigen ligase